ncbi:phosphatase PAP2 family protein [Pontibacter toksunensis]|uniref:Phosphatase PAP2 family protein n=1 Tax=Pontibacter toksunensis TaxID=1332631 RepID=A0ABW6BPE8_9BACT
MSDHYSASPKKWKHSSLFPLLFLLFLQQISWAQVPLSDQANLLQHNTQPLDTALSLPDLSLQEADARKSSFRKTAAQVGAGMGILAGTYLIADEPLQEFSQSNRSRITVAVARTVEPLGKPGNLAHFAGAAALAGILFKDPKLQKAGFASLGSIMATAVVTNTLKQALQRHRPSSATENHHFDGLAEGKNTSLPSAHTATAFAMATSVATVYKDSKWVPPLAYGTATLVGLSRIHDNAHWATDVLAGAAVGYLTSKSINRLYDVVNQKLKNRRHRLLLTPQVGLQSGSLSATLTF